MARAVDETRKTLMAVSTFCDTMILKEKLSLKMINQNNFPILAEEVCDGYKGSYCLDLLYNNVYIYL